MNRRLPVTLVGGFFGAGKTSLLHHFISQHRGGYLAIMAENPGALNLDAKALGGLCGAARRIHDVVMAMPSGDELGQVAWLEVQLRELASAGRFEQVVIELGGDANPSHLARHFGVGNETAGRLSTWAELHQAICVIDALDFFRGVVTPNRSPQDWQDFQSAQICAASLLVLNKCDLVDDAQRDACIRSIRSLNPDAPMAEIAYGELAPEIWNDGAPREELLLALQRGAPATSRSKAVAETPLSSVLYRSYRPFQPARFWSWLEQDFPGLLRVKGIVWLATRHLLVGGVSRSRWQNGFGPAGVWWDALPREEWPEEAAALQRMQEMWREPYGDRRQELVLIGEAGELKKATGALNACLLNDEELARPVKDWAALPDPFPAWDLTQEE